MEDGAPKSPNSEVSEPAAEAKAESRIVVLAKREAGVRSTVNFLERRGFAAKYASSLNEAVEMFSKKQADKLLLSVNFPHPKVEMLPVLMNQSFQIETILFAEETDRKTSNRLSNAKTKHVLFGPVSGPVVMMKIRQIDREISGETDETTTSGEKRNTSSKEDEGDIKVGGRKATNDDTVVLNGKSDKGAQASLENLMKSLSEEEDESVSSSGSLARSGETYIQKGDRSKMKSAGGDEDSEENAPLSERAQDLRAGLDRGLAAIPESKERRRLIMPNSFRAAPSATLDTGEEDSPLSYEEAAEALRNAEKAKSVEAAAKRAEREAAEAAKKAERELALSQQKSEREALAAKQRAEREASAAQMKAEREASAEKAKSDREMSEAAKKAEREAADVEAKAAKAKAQEAAAAKAREERANEVKDGRSKAAPESEAAENPFAAVLSDAEKLALSLEDKVRRCLHEALAIVAGAPKTEAHQLGDHAQAALVSLRTAQLNCAFVVSMNYAKQTANELFHRMEVAFFSLLRDHGVEFENNETYSIFLDNMNIVRDAFAVSEFAVITQTNEIEMGAAKVYVNDPIAKTELYEENMHSINLRDLPLNAPVTFNLFLHFKRNRKFLRYLKIGSTISDRQVSRLERHQATGLVEQTEVEAFQRHFAAYSIQSSKKPAA